MTLHVCHLIAPVRLGGGEALLCDMIGAKRAGLTDSVITIGSAPLFELCLRAHGTPVCHLGDEEVGAERRGRVGELSRSFGLIPALHAALRTLKPDLIHAHGFPPSWMAALPLGRGARRVYTHHYERQPPGALERRALTGVFNRYDALTAPADHLCQAMNGYFPALHRPFETLRIGLDERFYRGKPKAGYRSLFPPGVSVGTCVGRFVETKNQGLIVRAIAALPTAERARLGVLLVGSGPLEADLKAEVVGQGLDDTIRFLGQVGREEIPDLLASVDFAIFPTTTEASSLAAAEALASGLPVLALDIRAMRETVGSAGVFSREETFGRGVLEIAGRAAELAPVAREAGERCRATRVREDWARLYERVMGASPTPETSIV